MYGNKSIFSQYYRGSPERERERERAEQEIFLIQLT